MSERKTIVLTTWDRLNLASVIGQGKGDFATTRLALGVIDILDMNEDEAELAGMMQGENGVVGYRNPDYEFELEFTKEQFSHLRDAAMSFSGWPVNERVASLYDKLNSQ